MGSEKRRRSRLTDRRVLGLMRMAANIKRSDLDARQPKNLFRNYSTEDCRNLRAALKWIEETAAYRGLPKEPSKRPNPS